MRWIQIAVGSFLALAILCATIFGGCRHDNKPATQKQDDATFKRIQKELDEYHKALEAQKQAEKDLEIAKLRKKIDELEGRSPSTGPSVPVPTPATSPIPATPTSPASSRAQEKIRAEKIADLKADISSLESRIQDRKEGRRVCVRVIREASNESIRRQAERDRRTVETEIAQLERQLEQKTAELKEILEFE